MNELQGKIDSILFLESRPFTLKKLASVTGSTVAEVEEAVQALQTEYEQRSGGVTVVREGNDVQLMTAATHADFVAEYLAEQEAAELTRPSLETLTIVAYRGPVAKSEIELIRGVNCSLILRNLMIRGLVEELGETEAGSPIYRVTVDFLALLGVNKTADLPDYTELNTNVHLEEMLAASPDKDDFFAAREIPAAQQPDA
ncbi:MAG: SMC-Scp complex subunit ScpB [Candidatus Kerfeldbacteria bacterium CG15_BIG_FIL_POST_REV_8_21_14_020_45_12]|uniref:SMC-Scp complex subunit ScpB n=1 Tax=Candidatus Kerfeldbacteria bacterium CG15_BIG_FIL_POST_REV_8_21_14_020_45_12 TaxID=2014247 RepID=A0A2M7H3U1_9BACT|nr:MAG: SMC-Scp complex subunit ScpB [Candidatus Kerfeldbacteria bacterium CG15_BIG_FIL_POST_REV_8_21_14_020_45_12]PJA94021.1 MAG: SMC-Scp complex subunit ScpB [Candidatus Kerfeldbacteria bacterium CG_4_9_14_3_um_filter_45_8]